MKIKATVASVFKDRENGWSYSDTALRSLAESARGKPVHYQKKKIGVVTSGWYENGRAVVEADITKAEAIMDSTLFLVPGGLTDFDTVGDVLDACKAHQFFLTDRPSDQTLAAFEIID